MHCRRSACFRDTGSGYAEEEEDDVLILIGFFDGFLLGVLAPVSSKVKP